MSEEGFSRLPTDKGDDVEIGLLEAERHVATPSSFNALFQVAVPVAQKAWLEKVWLVNLYHAVSAFRGFQHRTVHLISSSEEYLQYAINLVFDSVESHNRWLTSNERQLAMHTLVDKGVQVFKINQYGGVEPLLSNELDGKACESCAIDVTQSRIHMQDAMNYLPRPQPPPKWKLFIIIYVNVIIVILIEAQGGSTRKMIAAGIPVGLANFFALLHLIPFTTYSTMPLCISFPPLSSWLRQPRPRSEDMHPVLAVLEQGLRMFAVQPTDIALQARVRKLEERLDRLRMVNHDLTQRMESLTERQRSGDTKLPHTSLPQEQLLRELSLRIPHILLGEGLPADSMGPLTMVVRHYVKWERELDFEQWTDRIDEEMRRHPGYQGMIRIAPKTDGDPYINSFTFDTLEHLISFQRSQPRLELLRELEPMLEATCEADLSQERVIHDAFSELFVSTGEAAYLRPPPLWKTCVLTAAPLQVILWLANPGLISLFEDRGLDDWSNLFLSCFVTMALNVYIGVPSMQYLFGEWLRLPVPRQGSFGCSALRWLDDGLDIRGQLAILVVYCSLNLAVGLTGH